MIARANRIQKKACDTPELEFLLKFSGKLPTDSYPLDPEYWITDSCALPAVGGGNQIQVFLKHQVLLIFHSIYKHF